MLFWLQLKSANSSNSNYWSESSNLHIKNQYLIFDVGTDVGRCRTVSDCVQPVTAVTVRRSMRPIEDRSARSIERDQPVRRLAGPSSPITRFVDAETERPLVNDPRERTLLDCSPNLIKLYPFPSRPLHSHIYPVSLPMPEADHTFSRWSPCSAGSCRRR